MDWRRVTALALLAAISLSAAATAMERMIPGEVVNGTNHFLGRPLRDFGPPLGAANFFNVAAHNPAGGEPLRLDPAMPPSTLLATGVDPNFLAALGIDPSTVDPAKVNLPLRNVAVNVDPAGEERRSLPGILAAGLAEPSQAEPAGAITLGDWLNAGGAARIRCSGDTAVVDLNLHGLIPNRLYTVWGVFDNRGNMMPLPLGGVPNVAVTDRLGKARFTRDLNFCPLAGPRDGVRLLVIDVVLHTDHQLYGALPDLPFAGLLTGLVNGTQLEFAIAGERLP